jgi:hypothetical protein
MICRARTPAESESVLPIQHNSWFNKTRQHLNVISSFYNSTGRIIKKGEELFTNLNLKWCLVNFPIKINSFISTLIAVQFCEHFKSLVRKKFNFKMTHNSSFILEFTFQVESFPWHVINTILVRLIDSTVSNLSPYHCTIIDTLIVTKKKRGAITALWKKRNFVWAPYVDFQKVMMTDGCVFFLFVEILALCFKKWASGVTMGTVHLGLCHIIYPYI